MPVKGGCVEMLIGVLNVYFMYLTDQSVFFSS